MLLDRADVQSRMPPLNLMNMRDMRDESPQSVGILMSAQSRNVGGGAIGGPVAAGGISEAASH